MAVTYTAAIKTARMLATRDAMAGGALEIVAPDGTKLVTFHLTAKGGEVNGEVWNLAFESGTVVADGTGVPATARMVGANGQAGVSGLTVGPGKDITLSYSGKNERKIFAGQDVRLTTAAIFHA